MGSLLSYSIDVLLSVTVLIFEMPFHLGLALRDAHPKMLDIQSNPDLKMLSSMQIMDKIVNAAARRGILVMLDLHSFNPDSNTLVSCIPCWALSSRLSSLVPVWWWW